MIGVLIPFARTALRTSIPSIFGNMMSRISRSYRSWRARYRPSAPSGGRVDGEVALFKPLFDKMGYGLVIFYD
jgi:hypothetical protein